MIGPLAIGVGALMLLMLAGKKKTAHAITPKETGAATSRLSQMIVDPNMPASLKEEIAKVIRRLNVQTDGTVQPPITKEDIQVATALAGKLDRRNFKEAAQLLRKVITAASKYVPSPPPQQSADIPGVSPEVKARIARALQLERDPAKLASLLSVLKGLPASSERNALIVSVESLITQLSAAASTADTLEQTQNIITSTKSPDAKSPASRLAQQLAASMIAAETRYGVGGAKARRDVKLIAKFQKAVDLKADGKPGVATVLAMARNGVSRLPLVMYWPRSATSKTVASYRKQVLKLAAYYKQLGQTQRASELAASAKREQGQGGIVGR